MKHLLQIISSYSVFFFIPDFLLLSRTVLPEWMSKRSTVRTLDEEGVGMCNSGFSKR